jgi:hypothetical protein
MSDTIHRIKHFSRGSRRCCVVLQDKNGPCPLVALTNTLLLRGSLAPFPADMEYVSSDWLCNVLAEYLFEKQIPALSANADRVADLEYGVADVVQLLPVLQHGMDVNVGFRDCTDYELTAETTLFDVFGVLLLHGWLADPSDQDAYEAVSRRRYNAALEVLLEHPTDALSQMCPESEPGASANLDVLRSSPEIASARVRTEIFAKTARAAISTDRAAGTRSTVESNPSCKTRRTAATMSPTKEAQEAEESERGAEAAHIRRFIENSPTQLTYRGLIRLHEILREGEYAVFFRNNHFSTITKHDGVLYVLVTDEGLAMTRGVFWERFDDLDGDTVFVDENWEPANAARCMPDALESASAANRSAAHRTQTGPVAGERYAKDPAMRAFSPPRQKPDASAGTWTPKALKPTSQKKTAATTCAGQSPRHSRCSVQ